MIELLDITVDIVFEGFFCDKNSKEILENFINSVLGLEGDEVIEVEELLDPRKIRIEVGRPSAFVDLSVKTRGGERYIIEVQAYSHERFEEVLLSYLERDSTKQIGYYELRPKKDWRNFPKVHIIAIIDCYQDEREEDDILNGKKVLEAYRFSPELSSSNEHLFDQWKATLIELENFEDKPLEELTTDKEKWFFFLKNTPFIEEKEANILKKDPAFQRALEKLERLSSDPAMRKAYRASINELRDHQAVLLAARKEGREEGFEKARREEENL